MENKLIEILNSGIILNIDNDNLVIKGNQNLITQDIINFLKVNKKKIMCYLENSLNMDNPAKSLSSKVNIMNNNIIKLKDNNVDNSLFLIHPIGGSVSCYYPLVDKLPSDFSIYAIQSNSIADTRKPLDSIEDLVNYYKSLILSIQPSGPYYLAGWSFGGIIAYSLAYELMKIHMEVKFVCLIDAMFCWGREESLVNTDFLINLFICDLFGHKEFSKNNLTKKNSTNENEKLLQAYEYCLENSLFDSQINLEVFSRLFVIFKSHNKAHIEFNPKPYDSPIYHIIADQKSEQTDKSIELWGSLTYNQQTLRVTNGNHYSIFSKNNIDSLAYEFSNVWKHAVRTV